MERPSIMPRGRTSSFYRSQDSLNVPEKAVDVGELPRRPLPSPFRQLGKSFSIYSRDSTSSISSPVITYTGHEYPLRLHSARSSIRYSRETGRASPLSTVLGIFPNRSQKFSPGFFNSMEFLPEARDEEISDRGSNRESSSADSPIDPKADVSAYPKPRPTPRKNRKKLKRTIKNHFISGIGEVFGTAMFLFFAFASILVVNTSAQDDLAGNIHTPRILNIIFISLGFGVSFASNIFIFARISGAMLNPAITLAMALVREITVVRAVVCFFAQIGGGILGAFLVQLLFPGPLDQVRTRLGHGTSIVQGVFMEALVTAELVTTVLMLARERCERNVIAAIAIGTSVFIAHLVGMPFTGVGMNPVRSFSPDVLTITFEKYHWIYWVGPTIGSLIGVCLYKLSGFLTWEDDRLSRPRLDLMV